MAKKDFSGSLNANDPALRFISTDKAPDTAKKKPADVFGDIPDGYKVVRAETRSKRMHIVVTPTLHEKIAAAAEAEGISQNEYINRLLERELLFAKS